MFSGIRIFRALVVFASMAIGSQAYAIQAVYQNILALDMETGRMVRVIYDTVAKETHIEVCGEAKNSKSGRCQRVRMNNVGFTAGELSLIENSLIAFANHGLKDGESETLSRLKAISENLILFAIDISQQYIYIRDEEFDQLVDVIVESALQVSDSTEIAEIE